MSRRKKAIERQRKQNTPEKKAKRAKKEKYASFASKEKWEDKKEKKRQSNLNRRQSQGVSVECPLDHWDTPSSEKCEGCDLKCSFKRYR